MARVNAAQDGDDEHGRPAAEDQRGVGQPLNGQHGPGQRAGVGRPPGRPGERAAGVEQDERDREEHIQRQAVLPRTRSKPHDVHAMSPRPGHPRWHNHRPGRTLRKLHAAPGGHPFVGAGPYRLPCRAARRGGMQWGHAHRTTDHASTPAGPLRDRHQPVDGHVPHPAHVRARLRFAAPSRSGPASADIAEPLADSAIHAEIDAASFRTGNPLRDRSVRSARSWMPPGTPSFPSGTGLSPRRQDGPRDADRARCHPAGQPVDRPGDHGRRSRSPPAPPSASTGPSSA